MAQERSATRRLAHNPALDGIRAIGMFSIMCGHLDTLHGAYVWIDTFFVLSGFLITLLLLIEHDKTGTVSVKQFYLRRAFRLMPAYLVYLAVGTVLVLVLKTDAESRTMFFENAITSLFYVNNYYRAWHWDAGTWFEHTWSLSVEEQFYFLWPLAFAALCASQTRRSKLFKILACTAIVLALYRFTLSALGVRELYIYMALETRADELLIGCALAVWRFDGFPLPWRRDTTPDVTSAPNKLVQTIAAGAPLWMAIMIVLCFVAPELGHEDRTFSLGGYFFVSLISAFLVLSLDQSKNLTVRIIGWGPLAYLGRISYGFYLWHWPVCAVVGYRLTPRIGILGSIVVVWCISACLALASQYLVEQPALRYRSKLSKRNAPGLPAGVAVASKPASVASSKR